MTNRIVEQYFEARNFAERIPEATQAVVMETGFVVERELFRGKIYDDHKVQTVVYAGTYEAQPAVLKLQGLRLNVEEVSLIGAFDEQNTSTIFRTPCIYRHEPFNDQRGFGYTIMELVDDSPLYPVEMTPESIVDFQNLYQDYKTKSIVKLWLENSDAHGTEFFITRGKKWCEIAHAHAVVPAEKIAVYQQVFSEVVVPALADVPFVFCHGHFTRKDLHRALDGSVVCTSNAFWSYRPQWYDLAFFLWERLMTGELPDFPEQIEKWITICEQIPCVALDPHFARRFRNLMRERAFGALVVDLGVRGSDLLVKEWESVLLG